MVTIRSKVKLVVPLTNVRMVTSVSTLLVALWANGRISVLLANGPPTQLAAQQLTVKVAGTAVKAASTSAQLDSFVRLVPLNNKSAQLELIVS